MKPYFVQYTISAVVMAVNETHAYQVAHNKRKDVFYDVDDAGITVEGEVTSAAQLHDGWDLECIPYNGDGNTRIGELLSKEQS